MDIICVKPDTRTEYRHMYSDMEMENKNIPEYIKVYSEYYIPLVRHKSFQQ